MEHPVLEALQGLPRAIWQTAPLLRQGKSMTHLEAELCPNPNQEEEEEGRASDVGGSAGSSTPMQRPTAAAALAAEARPTADTGADSSTA